MNTPTSSVAASKARVIAPDGREYVIQPMRTPKYGEWYITSNGEAVQCGWDPDSGFVRFILEPLPLLTGEHQDTLSEVA